MNMRMRRHNEESVNFIEVPVEKEFSTHYLDDFVHPEDYDELVIKLNLQEKDLIFVGKWDVLQCQKFPDKGLPLRVFELEGFEQDWSIEKSTTFSETLLNFSITNTKTYIIGREFKKKQIGFIHYGVENSSRKVAGTVVVKG